MTDIRYPKWQDVGISKSLIDLIKSISSNSVLDVLVSALVFRVSPKISYTYNCRSCGFAYRPERASEEVTYCTRCFTNNYVCSPNLKTSKETSAYSKSYNKLKSIIYQMELNHSEYFGVQPEPMECGWRNMISSSYCRFAGGETAEGFPRQSLVKSAILCPYLWDANFIWENTNANLRLFQLIYFINTGSFNYR